MDAPTSYTPADNSTRTNGSTSVATPNWPTVRFSLRFFQFSSSDIQFSDRWRFYQQHCGQHGLDGQRQQRPYLIARHHGRRPAKSNEFVDVRLVPSHQRSVADRLPLRPDAFVVQSTGNGPPAASATGRTGAEAPGRGRQTQADRCSSSTSQSVSGDERRRRVSIVSSPDRSRQTVPTRLPNLPARTLPLQVWRLRSHLQVSPFLHSFYPVGYIINFPAGQPKRPRSTGAITSNRSKSATIITSASKWTNSQILARPIVPTRLASDTTTAVGYVG